MHRAFSLVNAPTRVVPSHLRTARPRVFAHRRRTITAASPVEDEVATQTPVVLTDLQLGELRGKFTQGDGNYDLEAIRVLEQEVGLPVKDWFPADELDAIFQQGYVTFDQFSHLCEANLILEGKLKEYRTAFEAVDTSGNGSIGYNELYDLLHFLDSPLSDAKLTELMVEYDLDKSGQIEFNEFLLMFHNQFLDLKEVMRYTKQLDQSPPKMKGLIRLKKGEVTKIFRVEEFDEILDRNPDKLIVVFAGLTWCRPCRAMNRTYEKYAAQYPDVIFMKFFGNANSSTKCLFVQRLEAQATPAFFYFRNKEMLHSHTGKNTEKFEKYLKEYL